MKNLSIIVAMDRNGLIGNKNALPWPRLPADMKWFRSHTLNKSVIMGRKTFESIGKPLPHRENVVLSRSQDEIAGVVIAADLETALNLVQFEPIIIGGRAVYEASLPLVSRFIVTHIDGEFEGDTFFPSLDFASLAIESETNVEADTNNPFALRFVVYRKDTRTL
ncbi:MAG: dihydrofolate reductase [Candidatus Zambryskibacteria bacterium CG10_big_fil_rev_8_21_14_0_10_42_12]|uniref:Dihydrofolate reductase n=1 Tax=Candidatus Zambryskibacteria bacterium CG10_big_fil_rev_8_21_14_0_10_42_12 TaxID=1975115 RepID=A0A2H0QWY5_9BACT|nr:MAG: dihydrofolate reductase [Candidatus Zambryskibacteria bacterium CG10_big_fil_rev_8_21_14_0_10_42_12]